MSQWHKAGYNEQRVSLDQQSEFVFVTIVMTLRITESRRILWINGLAGIWKTIIAYTVSQICKEHGILGASFFCSRSDADCSDQRLVFLTLADQLGQFSTPFKEQFIRTHNADPGSILAHPTDH